MDNEKVPLGLIVNNTPTLIFIRPDSEKVLMEVVGIKGLSELVQLLKEAIEDGHKAGYLKP